MVPEIDFWAPEVIGYVLLYLPPLFSLTLGIIKVGKDLINPQVHPFPAQSPHSPLNHVQVPLPCLSCCSSFGTSRDQRKAWIPSLHTQVIQWKPPGLCKEIITELGLERAGPGLKPINSQNAGRWKGLSSSELSLLSQVSLCRIKSETGQDFWVQSFNLYH